MNLLVYEAQQKPEFSGPTHSSPPSPPPTLQGLIPKPPPLKPAHGLHPSPKVLLPTSGPPWYVSALYRNHTHAWPLQPDWQVLRTGSNIDSFLHQASSWYPPKLKKKKKKFWIQRIILFNIHQCLIYVRHWEYMGAYSIMVKNNDDDNSYHLLRYSLVPSTNLSTLPILTHLTLRENQWGGYYHPPFYKWKN